MTGMRSALVALLLLTMAAASALADGKVFARAGVDPAMPDQQALIHFDGRVQTLAIETRFEGDGNEFAWVVPLPGVPEISPATSGLFPTLRQIFVPRLADPSFGAMTYLLALLVGMAVVCVVGASGLRRLMLALVIVLALLGVVFWPSLGTPRGGMSASAAVTVHDRRIVGDYETATISSASADALESWLAEHGFAIPATAQPAIAAYARDGWVFVAVRLAREEMEGFSTPHPLVFRFETDQCIYPMRLTGVQDRPLVLDLYIFGTGTARAPGMAVASADAVSFAVEGEGIRILHSGLASLIPAAKAATRLTGTLTPQRMQQDLPIEFGPVKRSGRVVFSRSAGVLIAANIAVVSLIMVVVVMMVRRTVAGRRRLSGRQFIVAFFIAGAAGGLVLLLLPMTGHVEREHRFRWQRVHSDLSNLIAWRIVDEQEIDAAFVPTVEWVRAQHADPAFRESPGHSHLPEVLYQDSPGNFIVREEDGGLVYIWFGHDGREHPVALWPRY